MNAKFDFYDVVLIFSDKKNLAEIYEMEGAVLGKSQNEQGDWSYAVFVFTTEDTWSISEEDLIGTGRKVSRSEIY